MPGTRRRGLLSAARVAELEAIDGWIWSLADQAWDEAFASLTDYVAAHGSAAVPQRYVTAGGRLLGHWVRNQREERRHGRLSEQRAKALETQPGWAWAMFTRRAVGALTRAAIDNSPTT